MSKYPWITILELLTQVGTSGMYVTAVWDRGGCLKFHVVRNCSKMWLVAAKWSSVQWMEGEFTSSIDTTTLGGSWSVRQFYSTPVCLQPSPQPTIFFLFRSFTTWSSHLNLGLPTSLVLYGVHSVIFLVVLVFSIHITLAANFSLL